MSLVTSTSQASVSEARILVQGLTRQGTPEDEVQQKLDKTIRTIKTYLSSRHRESHFDLPLDHELIHSRQITQLLDNAGARYYFEEDYLFIYAMTSCIHEALGTFGSWSFQRLQNEILTPEEARGLRLGTPSLYLDGKIKEKGTKYQALRKSPDLSFLFSDLRTYRRYRTVIFESAFSETYDDLILDMKQWLLHGRGQVQLVILADFNEDKKQLRNHQKTNAFRTHAAKILKDFGNPLGQSKHSAILSLAARNDVHQDRATEIPSTPAKELDYDIVDVRVFPELTGGLPPIYAGDVIPLRCHDSFPNFDASRKFYLDLEEFRCHLVEGIRDDAVDRAYQFACPNSRDEKDGDYQE
ncbi:hypothetical protein APSETT444_007274 [Aspergillus pseudonomiae]